MCLPGEAAPASSSAQERRQSKMGVSKGCVCDVLRRVLVLMPCRACMELRGRHGSVGSGIASGRGERASPRFTGDTTGRGRHTHIAMGAGEEVSLAATPASTHSHGDVLRLFTHVHQSSAHHSSIDVKQNDHVWAFSSRRFAHPRPCRPRSTSSPQCGKQYRLFVVRCRTQRVHNAHE